MLPWQQDHIMWGYVSIIMPWWAEPWRHMVVGLYVCMYPSVGRIYRRLLKTKRWNKQHKQKSIFARKWIARILVIKLCSWVMAWFKLPTSVLLVIWFSVKTIMFLFNRIECFHYASSVTSRLTTPIHYLLLMSAGVLLRSDACRCKVAVAKLQ